MVVTGNWLHRWTATLYKGTLFPVSGLPPSNGVLVVQPDVKCCQCCQLLLLTVGATISSASAGGVVE
jgi:hypothetical protein